MSNKLNMIAVTSITRKKANGKGVEDIDPQTAFVANSQDEFDYLKGKLAAVPDEVEDAEIVEDDPKETAAQRKKREKQEAKAAKDAAEEAEEAEKAEKAEKAAEEAATDETSNDDSSDEGVV